MVDLFEILKHSFTAISGMSGVALLLAIKSPKFADLIVGSMLERWKRDLNNETLRLQAELSIDAQNHKHLLEKQRDTHIESIKFYFDQVSKAKLREHTELEKIIISLQSCANSLYESSNCKSSYGIVVDFVKQFYFNLNLSPEIMEPINELHEYVEEQDIHCLDISYYNQQILSLLSKINKVLRTKLDNISETEIS